MNPTVSSLLAQGVLDSLDVAMAVRLGQAAQEHDNDILLTTALCHRWARAGHACLSLAETSELSWVSEQGNVTDIKLPPVKDLIQKLSQSRLCGHGEPLSPFVLENSRLYLRRYAQAEAIVAARLRALTKTAAVALAKNESALLAEALPNTDASELQLQALQSMLTRHLLLLSGGPGTGKTWLAARLLAVLAKLYSQKRPRVLLLAPTGKAAQRLAESIRAQAQTLGEPWLQELASQAQTLHRALGYGYDGPKRHNLSPLSADWVIVDESSMIDLELMATLLDAIPEGCRLILLGDRRQLAAVGVGSVFADLCQAANISGSLLDGANIELKQSQRFRDDIGIGALAADIRAIENGTANAATITEKILAGGYTGIHVLPSNNKKQAWNSELRDLVLQHYTTLQQVTSPADALQALSHFRVLAALREGPFGVQALNNQIQNLFRQRLANLAANCPILIDENNHEVGLYNGDTGISLMQNGHLLVFFEGSEIRSFSPARLPLYSPAYAMTIHKSQGSEYRNIAVVLPNIPENSRHPLLSRELLYTAITRAREQVWLSANRAAIIAALSRNVERASGLVQRLCSK